MFGLSLCRQTVSSLLKCQASIPVSLQGIQRSISTTSPLGVIDSKYRSKKDLIKLSHKERHEAITPHSGYSDFGIAIPTNETPASLIEGVRFDMLPIVDIKSTKNNTIMTISDHTGLELLAKSSCGREGFKNAKKSTSVAAQATGLSVGLMGMKKGLRNVRIAVRGLGAGRLPSIKGLQMAGLKIISITDTTPLKHSHPRPRKAKRL